MQGRYTFESPGTLAALLVLFMCTVALLGWIPNPIRSEPSAQSIGKTPAILITVAAIVVLFAAHALVGRLLLFALPILAVIMLVWLKQAVAKLEWLYALGLALVAGMAGLGAEWITYITPALWAFLQVILVLTGLPAGWSMLRYAGLLPQGVGRSRFLSDGAISAARGFVQGSLIGLPWALGLVVMGGSIGEKQAWVKAWWQPLVAIQPGIAEEAWGRLLLVPLLFLLLRRVSSPRAAFTTALVVIGYWFAYLHTTGGLGALPSALIIGTLFVLPTSYLCLYRDLETAIGFHFWLDFVKFVFALVLFNR